MNGPTKLQFDAAQEAQLRAQVRTQLLGAGVPAGRVDEMVDLGFHAAERATDALVDVINRSGSTQVWLTALSVSLGVALARLQSIQTTLSDLGKQHGLPSRYIIVEANHG